MAGLAMSCRGARSGTSTPVTREAGVDTPRPERPAGEIPPPPRQRVGRPGIGSEHLRAVGHDFFLYRSTARSTTAEGWWRS